MGVVVILKEYHQLAARTGLDLVAQAAGVPLVITVNEETAVLRQVSFSVRNDESDTRPDTRADYVTLRECSL